MGYDISLEIFNSLINQITSVHPNHIPIISVLSISESSPNWAFWNCSNNLINVGFLVTAPWINNTPKEKPSHVTRGWKVARRHLTVNVGAFKWVVRVQTVIPGPQELNTSLKTRSYYRIYYSFWVPNIGSMYRILFNMIGKGGISVVILLPRKGKCAKARNNQVAHATFCDQKGFKPFCSTQQSSLKPTRHLEIHSFTRKCIHRGHWGSLFTKKRLTIPFSGDSSSCKRS